MYRVKHTPSGLYYQPQKHRGSSLSKRGKVYQTAAHGLSEAFKRSMRYKDNPMEQLVWVYTQRNGSIHKQFADQFEWRDTIYDYEVKAPTNITDWIIELHGDPTPETKKKKLSDIHENIIAQNLVEWHTIGDIRHKGDFDNIRHHVAMTVNFVIKVLLDYEGTNQEKADHVAKVITDIDKWNVK